jgi:hypothetical protein
MKANKMSSCCKSDSENFSRLPAHMAEGNITPPLRERRSLAFSKWSLPAVMLVLLLKCPACFAAYIAVGTGISLGVGTSAYLRLLLVALCVALLLLNVFWLVRKAQTRHHFRTGPFSACKSQTL